MRLAAGLLAPAPWATSAPATALVTFRLAPHVLDEVSLLESAFASPGRYAGEVLQRLRAGYPEAPAYLVFNPYLEIAPSVGEQVLERALALVAEPGGLGEAAFSVLSDGRRPLAYLLPAATAARCPALHLALLSTTDAALDERLLAASFGPGATRSIGQLAGLGARDGGHGFHPLSPALASATRRAAGLLEALPSASARLAAVTDGPRCAVIGFHAGDVLFWGEALGLEVTPFRSAVVLGAYADILRFVAPRLECLVVDQPAPHRPGHHVVDDLALLDEYAEQLGPAAARHGLMHLFRPFRDYSRPRHHLREAMAFAAGGRGSRLRPPPHAEAAVRERRMGRPLPGRVLCHFEGGWALKEYPRELRAELLGLLVGAGYEPLILGKAEPDGPPGVQAVPAIPYRDLASYRALLSGAEAVIGCDSFPAHFSQHLGVPTVQLFGSTRPDNARGLESASYRVLHRALPCVPCNLMTTCSLDGSSSCRAHATPHEVLLALQAMLPLPRPALAPRPIDEARRLVTEDLPQVAFPSRPAMPPWQRERFIDRMFGEVTFEQVTACPLCGDARLIEVGRRFRLPVAACQGCGLWLVTERIVERDLPVLYSQRYWTDFMRLHGYPSHHQRYPYDYAAALERVVDLAELVPPDGHGAVVDVGCALGAVPRRLREHGYRGHGLELDAALAREAHLVSGAPVHTSFDAVSAAEPELAAVVMYDVFEHLYHPVDFLRALAPRLAPDGVLLLETFRTDSPAFQRAGLDHEDVKPIEHPFMYRAEHLERLLREGGFTPVRVRHPLGDDHARVRVAARKTPAGGAS